MNEKYFEKILGEIKGCFVANGNGCQKPVKLENILKQIALDQREACKKKVGALFVWSYLDGGITPVLIGRDEALKAISTAEIEES